MYTPTLKSKEVNKAQRRIIVVVTFSDGVDTFDETFGFALNTTVEQIKKTVYAYLEELNGVSETIDNLIDVDYTPPAPTQPTAEETARSEWYADWGKLQTVDALIAAGVLTGTEPQVTTLRNKVKTGFKPAYL